MQLYAWPLSYNNFIYAFSLPFYNINICDSVDNHMTSLSQCNIAHHWFKCCLVSVLIFSVLCYSSLLNSFFHNLVLSSHFVMFDKLLWPASPLFAFFSLAIVGHGKTFCHIPMYVWHLVWPCESNSNNKKEWQTKTKPWQRPFAIFVLLNLSTCCCKVPLIWSVAKLINIWMWVSSEIFKLNAH